MGIQVRLPLTFARGSGGAVTRQAQQATLDTRFRSMGECLV